MRGLLLVIGFIFGLAYSVFFMNVDSKAPTNLQQRVSQHKMTDEDIKKFKEDSNRLIDQKDLLNVKYRALNGEHTPQAKSKSKSIFEERGI